MKIFIFSKEASRIRTEARADERAHLESHYLAEQLKQRKQYAEDKESMRKAHVKEIQDLESSLFDHYEKEIRKLKDELARKTFQLKSSQDAWELFKGVIPELKNYSSILETKAETTALARNRDLASMRELDDGLDSIRRKLLHITPQVDKLLSMDEIPLLIESESITRMENMNNGNNTKSDDESD